MTIWPGVDGLKAVRTYRRIDPQLPRRAAADVGLGRRHRRRRGRAARPRRARPSPRRARSIPAAPRRAGRFRLNIEHRDANILRDGRHVHAGQRGIDLRLDIEHRTTNLRLHVGVDDAGQGAVRLPVVLVSLPLGRRLRSVSGLGSPGRRSEIVPPNDSSSTCALPLPSVTVKRLVRCSLDVPGDREGRAEAAVVGAHHQRGVDPFGNRHRDQAVVRRQAVEALVLDRTVVGDVAVDGVEIDVARIDPVEDDAAVGRFGGEVAVDVREADALVHRADLDAALRFFQRDFPLHRLERHEPRAAAHVDVAARGFDVHVAADAFHRHVGVVPADADPHPRRHGDVVVQRAGRPAARRARPDRHHLVDLLDVDASRGRSG